MLATIPVEGGRIVVWSFDLTWDAGLEIADFEVLLENQSPTPILAPAALAIRKLDPVIVEFLNPDGRTSAGLLYRLFDDEFGEDGVLAAGESSQPLTFRFAVQHARSFAAVFELEPRLGGVIAGTVFQDRDEDGVQGESEPGFADADVLVYSADPASSNHAVRVRTGPAGGRLADITEFGFYANTLDQVSATSFFIDNVHLEVR